MMEVVASGIARRSAGMLHQPLGAQHHDNAESQHDRPAQELEPAASTLREPAAAERDHRGRDHQRVVGDVAIRHIVKSNQPNFSNASNCSIGTCLPNRYQYLIKSPDKKRGILGEMRDETAQVLPGMTAVTGCRQAYPFP